MSAIVQRYRLFICLAVLILFAGTAMLLGPTARTPAPVPAQPLTALRDGVFYINPENYLDTVRHLTKQNAVFLPAPQPEVPLVSSVGEAHGFVGAERCRDCHTSYVESAELTAHFRTCQMPQASSITGSFEEGRNILRTRSPDLWFEMSQKDDRFYQTLNIQRRGELYVHSEPIDLVTGSSKYGQTFLYWKNQCLYELPVSHFTERNEWVNSPGYTDGIANFARPVSSQCLECHSTWFEQSGSPFNRFISEGAILGVTCEKCHGPGRQHVDYHVSHPEDREARHMINPADFSRDRSLDLCSLCHSGIGEFLREPFGYTPGDRLADYLKVPPDTESGPGGVHSANQQARMALSRCFQESSDMRCTTCHNPHQQERGNNALFVQRCLTCHETTDCGTVASVGRSAEDRCIDCHMPQRKDSKMPMQGVEDTFHPKLRDHLIGVWDDVTADVLREIGSDLQRPGNDSLQGQQ